MAALDTAQGVVFSALGVLAFLAQLVALVDAARHRADAFLAAGKMTKQRWLIILGVAAAIGFVSLGRGALNFLNVIAFVAAAVYLVDVKPALRQVSGGGRGPRGVSGPW